jgi:adenosylhomocysteine nucleosidase
MIAVVFALEFEAADFVASSARRLCVDVWQLGVTGHRAAGAFERRLESVRPDVVVSAGFCGAIQPGLAVGTTVVAESYTTLPVDAILHELPEIRRGQLATVPNVITTSEGKVRLGLSSGALIADMETAHLADVCGVNGIPFFALRVVSDTCEQDLPVPGHVLIDPATGCPSPDLLFRYLLKNPRAAVGLNRLIGNSKLARRKLSAALETIIPRLLRRAEHS